MVHEKKKVFNNKTPNPCPFFERVELKKNTSIIRGVVHVGGKGCKSRRRIRLRVRQDNRQ